MRYTPEDRASHIALWQESGLSKAGYCRSSGLCYKTFCGWARPRAASTSKELVAAPAFVQVVDQRPHRVDAACGVDVEIDGGVRLRFAAGASAAWVGAVVQAVRSC